LNNLKVTEHNNIRVLTTQQIAEAYGADAKVISNNFNRNKERYLEGKHFICLEGEELKEYKTNHQFDESSKINKLYLWTEKGCFLHAKSLGTDKAWEVYENLVDFYFSKKKPMSLPEQIKIVAQGYVELEHKVDEINNDLQEFKRDMPLLALECQKITQAKNQKVVPLLGGKGSPAYQNASLRQKVYTDIDSQIRRNFGVSTYKAIKRNQCDLVIELICKYSLPLFLEEQIEFENSQMGLGV
jgi:hypothetical protein